MILDAFDLHGQVAMVTGASRGLGYAMAEGLAEAGADIVAVSRGPCDALASEVARLGRRFLPLRCDLAAASVADLWALIDRAVAGLGTVDILVNAAGVMTRRPALEHREEEWDTLMRVNLKAAMFLSQAAGRHMAARGGGKIVMVGSALSYQGGYTVPAYAGSKHGVLGLTRALANELAALHINVNAIMPGYMHTEMTAPLAADPERRPAIDARIPAGRWGRPDDLKGAVVFFASAASDYCHASALAVDGAWLSR